MLLLSRELYRGVCLFVKFRFKNWVKIILKTLQSVMRNGLMNTKVMCAVGYGPPVRRMQPALLTDHLSLMPTGASDHVVSIAPSHVLLKVESTLSHHGSRLQGLTRIPVLHLPG